MCGGRLTTWRLSDFFAPKWAFSYWKWAMEVRLIAPATATTMACVLGDLASVRYRIYFKYVQKVVFKLHSHNLFCKVNCGALLYTQSLQGMFRFNNVFESSYRPQPFRVEISRIVSCQLENGKNKCTITLFTHNVKGNSLFRFKIRVNKFK